MPPLPHHRAYGSVPRRFGGLSTRQFFHGRQSETTETGFGEAAVQGFRKAQAPRSLWAEDGRTGRAFRNVEATEFTVALAARLPLDSCDATQASPSADFCAVVRPPCGSLSPEGHDADLSE
jgi:hypothetical protein